MIHGIYEGLKRGLFFGLLFICCLKAFPQGTDPQSDSLYSSRLMQANLELYGQIDSLNVLLKETKLRNNALVQQIDSLKTIVARLQGDLVLSNTKVDTLLSQKLHTTQELLSLKQQMLLASTALEERLQLLREKEYQLNECEIKLKEAKSEASLNQAKLEGKIDVNNTKVEARDREIAYMNETIAEKVRIIAEKTTELSVFYRDKSTTLRLVDSLSRALNVKELELIKVSERLKIIESQYNELVAQRTAAQNKKKKVRFVQGVALKNYRTPDYQLAPQSSASTATYVITNKNAGNLEFDYITGVSLSLYDLSKPDGKYTYDAGLFFGFGGTNLFKNFYVSPSFKAFDFFHFMIGLNIAEYQQLQSGFNEGDVLPPGMGIPTVKEWKANMFFGMTIDFELLSNIPKKM
jgi:hypothetical protein